MPTFTVDDIDIYVDEFLENCSPNDIKEVIDYLIDMGHINSNALIEDSQGTIQDKEWAESLSTLSGSRLRMPNEEIEIIKIIAKKYE